MDELLVAMVPVLVAIIGTVGGVLTKLLLAKIGAANLNRGIESARVAVAAVEQLSAVWEFPLGDKKDQAVRIVTDTLKSKLPATLVDALIEAAVKEMKERGAEIKKAAE